MRISGLEFEARASITQLGGRALEGAFLVMVEGRKQREVAAELSVSEAAISRVCTQMERVPGNALMRATYAVGEVLGFCRDGLVFAAPDEEAKRVELERLLERCVVILEGA